jgi:hypothetical protein
VTRPTWLQDPTGGLALLALGAALLPFLAAVGQPVWTDDLWWHLALGEAYAQQGPWLAGDPLLFTAEGPPIPAAWLADLGLHGVAQTLGIQGLRALHVALGVGVLALVFGLLRRLGGGLVASAGTLVFVALAAYRLVQLRPHVASIAATLALLSWVVVASQPPSWRRVGLAALGLGIWANLHASFLLGPILLGAALAGLVAARVLGLASGDANAERIRRLGVLLLLGSLATLANPGGLAPHLAYLAADAETLSIGRVSDEWSGLAPFAWPSRGLPPSPLGLLLYWTLAIATATTLALAFRRRAHVAADPALAALALAGLVAPLFAVRFLWLGMLPLVWLASFAGAVPLGRGARAALGAFALAVSVGFFAQGPWPSISRGMPRTVAGYSEPYAAGKYHAHAVWMLRDAGLEGRMFQEYSHGGFLGYALAPRIETFINGSLNVPGEILRANRAIRDRRGLQGDQTLPELLDALEMDLFFGIRLPVARQGARPWFFTSKHLEQTPGWTPIFRNLDTVVYLRTNARNRDNLARVERYYASRGVPFDPEQGFRIEDVMRSADSSWALEQGVVPYHLYQLTTNANALDATERGPAREQLGALYAALGVCSRSLRYDRQALREDPQRVGARRRRVWCLLHERRFDEARSEAAKLRDQPAGDRVSHAIAAAAAELPAAEATETAARLATLPLFDEVEASWLGFGFAGPAARELRPTP